MRNYSRRHFLKTAGAAGLASAMPQIMAMAKQPADHGNTDERPNILFCISDDQSWLHTSFAGDPVIKTPAFDRVARNGLYFENAFTCVASCAPSRASILTGQKFWRLEEAGLLFGKLKTKFPIITKLLADAGYEIGLTTKGYAPARRNLYDTWDPFFGKDIRIKAKAPPGIRPIDYAASFEQFMNEKPEDKPFLFWMGPVEPHRSYKYGIGKENGIDPDKVIVPPFLPDTEEVRNDIADYFFEIQWQDQHLQRAIDLLEKRGMLHNTIVVATSDNGMPFPRAKATAYNYGLHMPLAIMWADKIKPDRRITDFVNNDDFAPTFLQAAGLPIPEDMTGKSLMDIFTSDKQGQIDPKRNFTLGGFERHVWSRPGGTTYGRRAIYTEDWTYIHNHNPERWPMGDPDFTPSHQGQYGDIDNGPTKTYMIAHQNDPQVKELFKMSFGKLPADELYNAKNDPAQIKNLAADPKYTEILKKLKTKLQSELKRTADPRSKGQDPWTDYPFYAAEKYLKGDYLEEVRRWHREHLPSAK